MPQKLDITDDFIRARQADPSDFEKNSFRTIRLGKGIKAIIGRKKGEKSTSIQSVLFPKDAYSEEEALDWLSSHESKFADACKYEDNKTSLFEMEDEQESMPDEEDTMKMEMQKLHEKIDMLMGMMQSQSNMSKKDEQMMSSRYLYR